MRKVIVTTTINPPTKAVRLYDAMPEWELVVIGDLKTPKNYNLERGTYVDPQSQERYDKALSDMIGWNCIARRSFGLLLAHDIGADVVALVDDDNIPLPGWGQDLLLGREVEVDFYETDLPAFDPVGATNHPHLWHRGFPLQLLPKRDYSKKTRKRICPDVQADFWNGDPDIDAICRMEHAPSCNFDTSPFPMATDKLAPFNSQNTFLNGALLRDYFLFPGIGRMEDIWAAYYMQAKGAIVVYNKASVFQERNAHDLVRDMQQEYLGYENNLSLVEQMPGNPDALFACLPDRAVQAFDLYKAHFSRG